MHVDNYASSSSSSSSSHSSASSPSKINHKIQLTNDKIYKKFLLPSPSKSSSSSSSIGIPYSSSSPSKNKFENTCQSNTITRYNCYSEYTSSSNKNWRNYFISFPLRWEEGHLAVNFHWTLEIWISKQKEIWMTKC